MNQIQLDYFKQQILDTYCNTTKNIFVSATAGSGKTFVLLQLLNNTSVNKKCLFVAFNKSIAEELQTKTPQHVTVGTIHSMALKSLIAYKECLFIPNEDNDVFLFKRIVEESNPKKLFQKCKSLSYLLNKVLMGVGWGSAGEIEETLLSYGEDPTSKEIFYIQKAIELKKELFVKSQKGSTIDCTFTDFLFYALEFIPLSKFKKFDVVFVDELQDLAPIHRDVVLRFLKRGGRLVTVGDDKQCIYGFQGANLNSFNYFKNRPNTVCLPLSTTYRCAKAIVKEACKVFPGAIQPLTNAPEGVVGKRDLKEIQNGDFVICRNNLPLFELFIYLLKSKKNSYILGKEYKDKLLNLMQNANTIHDLDSLLQKREAELLSKGMNIKYNERYQALKEQIDIIKLLIEHFGSFNKVKDILEKIFKEQRGAITLSTIHKSKGLEADRVWFLNPELIPSEYAVTSEERYNEQCLKFVAITRAKKELYYTNI